MYVSTLVKEVFPGGTAASAGIFVAVIILVGSTHMTCLGSSAKDVDCKCWKALASFTVFSVYPP